MSYPNSQAIQGEAQKKTEEYRKGQREKVVAIVNEVFRLSDIPSTQMEGSRVYGALEGQDEARCCSVCV